jgi:hypothetical protein
MKKCNGNNTQDWGFDAIFKMMNPKRFEKHLRLLSGVTFA